MDRWYPRIGFAHYTNPVGTGPDLSGARSVRFALATPMSPVDAPTPPRRAPTPPCDVTLGVLAGGRATRLGGLDKAWLARDGVAQVLRRIDEARAFADHVLVSANAASHRYRDAGLCVVADGLDAGAGPVAGLAALAAACQTRWLATVPVDALHIAPGVFSGLLMAADRDGAWLVDADGPQPLVAVWNVARLRARAGAALSARRLAVRDLIAGLAMTPANIPDLSIGNINTPADLDQAGMSPV